MLANLFLGKADGESEAKEKDFLKLFYKNDTYDQLMTERGKFIISGQKGTGKTLMAKYIEETFNSEKRCTCKILNRNSINLTKLIESAESEREEERVAFYSWFFLTESAKLIMDKKIRFTDIEGSVVEKIMKYHKFKDAIKKLNAFMNERYQPGNYVCHAYNQTERLKETNHLGVTAGQERTTVGMSKSDEYEKNDIREYNRTAYYNVHEELKHLVMNCLQLVNVIIILDDLDEIDCKLEKSKSSRNNLLALITAAKDLNDSLFEKESNSGKCIILIRRDILDTLNHYSSNLNKLIVDRTVTLDWIRKSFENPEEHPLIDMILTKIQATNSEYRNLTKKKIYQTLFMPKIENKNTLSYLLDYSFGRPRDIINYLNIVKNNNRFADSFKAPMFREARAEYSRQFKAELLNEMHIHLDESYSKELLQLLKDYGKPTFYFSEIAKFYRENKDKYKKINSAKKAVENLYRFSVIGNSKKTGNKVKFFWAYRLDGSPTPDFSMKFSVHYAMRKSLNM